MCYKGKKVVRILGRFKSGIGIMILQFANRAVEVVKI